jgi:uncharacterized membrane protein
MELMLTLIAFTALSSHLAPRLTSPDVFFGVTVAPAFRDRPVARSVSLHYAVEIWVLALVAGVFVATSNAPLLSVPVLLTQGLGAAVAFAKARYTLLPYAATPTTVREAEIAPRPSLPGGILGQLGPFVILLAAAVYIGMHWGEMPARFPRHWNIAGQPNGWSKTSVGGVYGLLWMGVAICGVTFAVACAVLYRTRLPRVTGEEGQHYRRARQINLMIMLASEYLVATLIAWSALVPLFSAAPERAQLPLALRLAPFALTLLGALAITRARALRRIAAADGQPIGDATPDSCWVLGLFYVNRADPAIFVERRMGMGYAPNFGNPWSWLMMIAFLALSFPVLVLL